MGNKRFSDGANALFDREKSVNDPRVEGGTPGSNIDNGPGSLRVFRYPMDVGSDEYPHYAMFYISKRSSDVGSEEVLTTNEVTLDKSNENRPDRLTSGQRRAIAGYAGAVGVGTAAVEVAKDTARFFGGRANSAIKTTAALTGAGVGIASLSSVVANRERVMLRDAIALYMNDKPSTTYKAGWDTDNVGTLGGAPEILSNVGSNLAAGEILQAGEAALRGLGGVAGTVALKNADKGPLSQLGNVSSLVQSSSGIAPNPFKVQMFRNMGFRNFSFTYTFLPKNKEEYKQAKEIIMRFKKYMHPTRKNTFFLGYPAEFSIIFFYKDAPNEELFKISSCALTDMRVEYGGTDFVTFKGTKGAPAEMTMSLTFAELEILTDDRIQENY